MRDVKKKGEKEMKETGKFFNEDGKTFRTTSDFWDCECPHDYIHSSDEDECPKCGAIREEQPDATIEEVEHYGKDKI